MDLYEAAITAQSEYNIKSYYSLAAITILYYDFSLTLPLEVERYWVLKGFSWARLFFYINRYSTLLAHIPIILEYFGTAANIFNKVNMCRTLHIYHQYYAVVAQLIIAILLIIRTNTLYSHNRRLLAFLSIFLATLFVLGCAMIATSGHSDRLPPEIWPRIGCLETVNDRQGTHLAVAWGGLLVFDLLIYCLTLRQAFGTHYIPGRSLFHIILRDASIYIAVIFAATLSNVITMILAPPTLKGVSTTFSNIMASVIVSRLLLNLRDPSLLAMNTPSTKIHNSIRFAQAEPRSNASADVPMRTFGSEGETDSVAHA